MRAPTDRVGARSRPDEPRRLDLGRRPPMVLGVTPPVGLAAASVGEGLLVPRYVIGSTVGLALLVAGQVAWHTEPHDDFRSVARHLEAEAQPGDGLFLPNPFVRPQLDYLADPTFAATYEVAESTTYDGDLTRSLLVRR